MLSILTLLFSLLDAGQMGSHFHEFNNVQNQIQDSKEIWTRARAGNHFFFYQLLKLVVWTLHLYMRYEINNKNVSVWIHNNKMTCVYLAVSVSESVSLLYAVKP